MSNYVCKKCGHDVFSHDVTDIYGETFNSTEKIVVEGKHYTDGDDWVCDECHAEIPKEDIDEFLMQMFDAGS